MKKTNRPSGQKTLFQTWNKQGNRKQNQNSLFETWGSEGAFSTSTVNAKVDENKQDNLEDLITIGDDDDDKELLAVIDQIEESENANTNDVGNLSFSASTNDEGSDVIPGFDCAAGNSWIYPTNYPLRDYQFNIVQKALFHNTLVTLPTGLGKTFIAAVVMYNFYRWYPQGKVIFMAPTKPLVAQQIDACYDIMGIPRQDTAEMTGNMAPAKREFSWKEKRVFFLTPQVFQNDLSRGSCRADDVVCLVFDEAHKALGNHSYCQVVREVLGYNQNFRILALSATPGDGIKAVQQVITNLLVSHIELRSEDSTDIKPYTHERQVEKIVVKLGDELEFFKTKYLRVLRIVVSRLSNYQVLWMRDPERVNKCMLLAAREQFRKKCTAGQQPRHQIGPIEGDFAVAISLYHGYDLLMQHGLLPFYNFIKGITDGSKGGSKAKTELSRNPDFVGILDDLRDQIEPDQSDGNGSNVKPSFIGHPKLVKLKDIVLEHFQTCENAQHAGNTKGSRVMIFSQFRDSVQEISRMLSAYKPLVKVMSFIGQQSKGNMSKGLTQKEQLEVIRQFRNGGYNTLVATCVGEEGLDIGEVDLIVCFDASASPIRLVQRMGRTGRKRNGRIIVLVTEGKEEQIYQRSQRNKSNIHKTILDSARTLDLYMENPRMVPRGLKPVCQKIFITVDAKSPKKNKSNSAKSTRKSEGGNIKKLLSSCSKKDEGFLSPEELRYWNDNFKLPMYEAGLTPSKSTALDRRPSKERSLPPKPELSLNEWTAWQTPLQEVHFVNHSKRSRHFTEILEFCDFRRDCGDSEDSYDLEMRSFLNSEDIIQPDKEKAAAGVLGNEEENRNKRENGRVGRGVIFYVDSDDEETSKRKDGNHKRKAKAKDSSHNKEASRKKKSTDIDLNNDNENDDKVNEEKTSRKRKSADFDSDTDDDFESISMNVSEKKANIDHKSPCLDQSLRTEAERISPTEKQLQPSQLIIKNKSESSYVLKRNQSKSTEPTITKHQSESKLLCIKQQSKHDISSIETNQQDNTSCIVGNHSEFPQDLNDEMPDLDNQLSDLLDIPSTQRQRNVTRHQMQAELKTKSLVSELLPDAPSLDTLLNLSAVDTGESLDDPCNQEEESDRDFFPSMFNEIPKTDQDNTHSNIGENCLESGDLELGKRKSFDDISDNECDKFGLKNGEILERVRIFNKTENLNKQGESEKAKESEKVGGIDNDTFRDKVSVRKAKVHSSNSSVPNETRSGVKRTFGSNEKTLATQEFDLEDEIEGVRLESKKKSNQLDQDKSVVFGFRNKDGDDQDTTTAFFDDGDDDLDRVICDIKTPCLFDDDNESVQNRNETSNMQTSKPQFATHHSPRRTLCTKAENIEKKKSFLQTPCLFDDDEFGLTQKGEQSSEQQYSNEQTLPRKLCSKTENIDAKKNKRKPRSLFNDEILQNEKKSQWNVGKISKSLPTESLYTEVGSINAKKNSENEKLLTRMSPKKPLLERNVNAKLASNGSPKLMSRVNESTLKTIHSFSFSKQETNQQPPDDCDNDVVAPSPSRIKARSLYSGRTENARSFREMSFSKKSVCSEIADEIKLYRNRRKMLSLTSKVKGIKSSQGFAVDAEVKRSNSPHKNGYLLSEASMNDNGSVRIDEIMDKSCLLKPNTKNMLTTKRYAHPAFDNPSSFKENSIFVKDQTKTELHYDCFDNDLADEEIDLACVRTMISSTSPTIYGKDKKQCVDKDVILKEKQCFKSPSHADRKTLNGFKISSLNKTISDCVHRQENESSNGSVENSPLVNKAKRKVRSKPLESESEGELSDKDLEDAEKQIFSNDKGVANTVLEISDSDEEFDQPIKVTRKRKFPVDAQGRNTKPKKRRPHFNDFLDDEAEVSEDAMSQDSLYDDGDDLEEMEDSFIDDRSQLTQRSPLTAMKPKKKDTSVNMMDIYRISLLTPQRQQLRFRTPAFHCNKNRYKMVFDGRAAALNTSTSSIKEDSHYETSTESEESGKETTLEESMADVPSVSPGDSQIVARKNRRGKRRLLADSYFTSPEASDPEHQTKLSDDHPKRPEDQPKLADQSKCLVTSRGLNIDISKTRGMSSIHSKNSGDTTRDDVIFKRPGHTAPVSKGLYGNGKSSRGCLGINENSDDILAALNDSDDALFMLEINALPSLTSTLEVKATEHSTEVETSKNTTGVSGLRNCDRNLINRPSLSRSLQLNSKKTRDISEERLFSSESDGNGENFGKSSTVESNTSHLQHKSTSKLKCELSFEKTNIESRSNTSVTDAQNNKYAKFGNSENINNYKTSTEQTKANEILCTSKIGKKSNNVSPLFPPLSKMISSKDNTPLSCAVQDKSVSSSEQIESNPSESINKMSVISTEKSSPALTATQRDKNKLTVLVGSKEVSNCQIVSLLRRKHNIKTVVSSIAGCDYIVSTRMAVERKFVSDISNQANNNKLIARVRELCDLYDRPCIVIEKDRMKNGETQLKCEVRSKYFDRILACLAHTHVKVLFSDDQEGTSDILASLAQIEARKNHAIIYPLPLSKEREQIVKFLCSIPRTSYITAVSLCYHNKTLQEIINSSPEALVKRVKTLSLKRSNDILKFLQHGFSADMVNCGNK